MVVTRFGQRLGVVLVHNFVVKLHVCEELVDADLGAEERANAPDPRRPNGAEGEARGAGEEDTPPDYREVFGRMLRYGVGNLTPEERSPISVPS